MFSFLSDWGIFNDCWRMRRSCYYKLHALAEPTVPFPCGDATLTNTTQSISSDSSPSSAIPTVVGGIGLVFGL
jgi:hypothetical protein